MMLEVFHLVVADADVYLAASEDMLEQVQVVGKTLEVLEIVAQLTAEAFQHVALHRLHELGHASLCD